MSFVSSAVGLGVGLIGSVGKMIGNSKANQQLRSLQSQDPNYATSQAGIQNNQVAQGRYGLAETILNSQMPGTAQEQNNILGNQSNVVGNANRSATNSAQALVVGSGAQGQTNQAFSNLAGQQADWYKSNLANYNQAGQGVINEGDKEFQDQIRQFGDKAQIQGAINANRQNTWGSIANGGFSLANFGMNGGFGGMFGGGGSGGSGLNNSTQAVGNIPGQGLGVPSINTTPTFIDPNTPNLQYNYQNPYGGG